MEPVEQRSGGSAMCAQQDLSCHSAPQDVFFLAFDLQAKSLLESSLKGTVIKFFLWRKPVSASLTTRLLTPSKELLSDQSELIRTSFVRARS